MTVVRDRKIRTALRTNQIVGFITVPAWKKMIAFIIDSVPNAIHYDPLLLVGNSVVLSVPPERVCRFNPCEKSACFTSQADRCAVSYKCKPIFFGADGQRLNCRGIYGIN